MKNFFFSIGFVYTVTKYMRNPSHMNRESAIAMFHGMKIINQDVLNRYKFLIYYVMSLGRGKYIVSCQTNRVKPVILTKIT